MAGICRRTLQNVTVGVIIASGSGNRSRIGSSAPETEAGQGLFPAQGPGRGASDQQPIAANIDCALIVQASPLNLNLLERYLELCAAAGIGGIVLLSKCDLLSA